MLCYTTVMRTKKTAGYTLIEVVVTFALMSAVFVIFQASINSILLNRRVKHQELALRVATTKMEQIRSLSYDTVPASGSFNDALLAQLPEASATVTVSDYDAATKRVAVSVSWRERGSQTLRDVTLTTLVTKEGI